MTADPPPRYGIWYIRFLLTYKIHLSISYRYRDILAISYRYRIEFQKPISLHHYFGVCYFCQLDISKKIYGRIFTKLCGRVGHGAKRKKVILRYQWRSGYFCGILDDHYPAFFPIRRWPWPWPWDGSCIEFAGWQHAPVWDPWSLQVLILFPFTLSIVLFLVLWVRLKWQIAYQCLGGKITSYRIVSYIDWIPEWLIFKWCIMS